MSITFSDSPIAHIQLAMDAHWETALRITAPHANVPGVNIEKLEQWLDWASEDIAIEAFIPIDSGFAFVGVRLAGLMRSLQRSIVTGIVHEFRASSAMSVLAFVHHISTATQIALFDSDPQFLELGKVNAWRTFGAVRFWNKDSARSARELFSVALAEHARFRGPSDLPYAIEAQFGGALVHWFAVPVSESREGAHRIAERRARYVLATIENIRQQLTVTLPTA